MATFQIRGSWYVQLRGDLGEVLLRSAQLDAEHACGELATRIQRFLASPDRIERRAATNGGHYFTLHDDAGTVLGRSPTYESSEACDRAITKVQQLSDRKSRP